MPNKKGSNWQELLRRWLSGAITAREEQDLDRYAQNDPFLAEALEGYRRNPQGEHQNKIAALQGRFIKRKPVFHFWQLAAAVAVLVLAGVAMWQLNPPAGENLAQMEMADQATDKPLDTLNPAPQATEELVLAKEVPATPPAVQTAPRAERKKGPAASGTLSQPAKPVSPPSPVNPSAPTREEEAPPLADVPAPASYDARPSLAPPPASPATPPAPQTAREIAGNESLRARQEEAEKVNSAALDEVVVVDRNAKEHRKMKADAPLTLAAPAPSIDTLAYRRYIQQNLRYPEAARQAGIEGIVTLQFSINKRGKPTNFVKLQSLGAGCDEEAIRLLQEGPAWIPAGKSVGTYSIRFELE